ncbi:hypothetical protein QBC40DRAFT_316979 [Triangularia verruculosa]|uniref:Protein NO VEIN C-terminal domain-containing protein n=1 Tax=Triangularia verruculosa TaxID=2587418 RepID=A0AAN6XMY1_9PEZI|nr:hypothetical protein QBC40DRAFT_316979 [Triangularia verruculosa]
MNKICSSAVPDDPKGLVLVFGLHHRKLSGQHIFLLSCITPTVKEIALYRVSVTQLAQNLQTQGLNNSNNVAHLIHPALPSYWYWGISGICDVFEAPSPEEGAQNCRRAFPPTQNLLALLEESLRDSLGHDNRFSNYNNNDTERVIRNVISSWNATISKPRVASFLREKEDGLAVWLKASVGLVIAAVVLDFGIAIVAPCLFREPDKTLSSLSFVSELLALGAGVSAVLSMKYGVRGAAMSSESGGPAIIVLFVGVAIRTLPIAMGLFSFHDPRPRYPQDWRPPPRPYDDYYPPPPGPPHIPLVPIPPPTAPRNPPVDPESRRKDIGYAGEKFIFNFFRQRSLPKWSYHNWTSGLRSWKGEYPDFDGWERDHADFTYDDIHGRMRQVLSIHGAQILPHWQREFFPWGQRGARYHIEVKSTPLNCETPFFISKDQVRKMQLYAHSPMNAYIIARVYHVESATPRVRWFSNPLQNGDLELLPLENGKFEVRTR